LSNAATSAVIPDRPFFVCATRRYSFFRHAVAEELGVLDDEAVGAGTMLP
jgi:hypothetical protein